LYFMPFPINQRNTNFIIPSFARLINERHNQLDDQPIFFEKPISPHGPQVSLLPIGDRNSIFEKKGCEDYGTSISTVRGCNFPVANCRSSIPEDQPTVLLVHNNYRVPVDLAVQDHL
jgi:hypothetical protein